MQGDTVRNWHQFKPQNISLLHAILIYRYVNKQNKLSKYIFKQISSSLVRLNSGQLIFKYVFSKLFQSKRLLKYDTYMES